MADLLRLVGLVVVVLVGVFVALEVISILFGFAWWLLNTLVTLAIVAAVLYLIYLFVR